MTDENLAIAERCATPATAVDRLLARIPPKKLKPILERLADRLDELARSRQGAELELHIRVVRGRFFEARWDADERIG